MWIEPIKDRFRAVERYIDPMTGKSMKVSVMIDKDTASFRKRAQALLQARIEEKLAESDNSAMTLQKLVEKYLAGLKSEVQTSAFFIVFRRYVKDGKALILRHFCGILI